nr:vegetative cell wall protein gp1-like [Aegilops tauschii subsp. strangulata]
MSARQLRRRPRPLMARHVTPPPSSTARRRQGPPSPSPARPSPSGPGRARAPPPFAVLRHRSPARCPPPPSCRAGAPRLSLRVPAAFASSADGRRHLSLRAAAPEPRRPAPLPPSSGELEIELGPIWI